MKLNWLKMKDRRIWVGTAEQLTAGSFKKLGVVYRNRVTSVIVFSRDEQCYAYINQCVHMPRTLDCNSKAIFDASGNFLRCSFHGIVYDPCSGESVSTLCHGERLTSVRILQNEQGIWLNDKRVTPLPGAELD